jgi:hypothetical protein
MEGPYTGSNRLTRGFVHRLVVPGASPVPPAARLKTTQLPNEELYSQILRFG